jgi:hypothetical protein
MDRVETAFRLAFKVAPFVCYEGNAALNLHYSWAFHALKGHGFKPRLFKACCVRPPKQMNNPHQKPH